MWLTDFMLRREFIYYNYADEAGRCDCLCPVKIVYDFPRSTAVWSDAEADRFNLIHTKYTYFVEFLLPLADITNNEDLFESILQKGEFHPLMQDVIRNMREKGVLRPAHVETRGEERQIWSWYDMMLTSVNFGESFELEWPDASDN